MVSHAEDREMFEQRSFYALIPIYVAAGLAVSLHRIKLLEICQKIAAIRDEFVK
jgi:hypothetical protein